MEILKNAVQALLICAPLLAAIIKYLDVQSSKRQKVLQDAMFLMLQGIDCVGNLSKCTAHDLITGVSSGETERALKCYEQFSDDLKGFQSKITSKAL